MKRDIYISLHFSGLGHISRQSMQDTLVLSILPLYTFICCGKVMFSVVSVRHSVNGGGLPIYDHCPWCIGPHYAGPSIPDINHVTSPQTWPPACDIWWPSLETCSNLFIWGPPPFQEHVVVPTETRTICGGGGCASYLNVFLLLLLVDFNCITPWVCVF